MTFFAFAGSGGAFGASGFVSAPSIIPVKAAIPKPQAVRARISRRVICLSPGSIDVKEYVGIQQTAHQFSQRRGLRSRERNLPVQKRLRLIQFFLGRRAPVNTPPRVGGAGD